MRQLTLQVHGRLDCVRDKPGRIFQIDSRLYYVLKYPPSSSDTAIADTREGAPRPNIAGAFVLCPMVDVSPESRPSALIEYIAKGIKYFAGSLPLAKAVRGNVSDDPRVEADFFSDREFRSCHDELTTALCYHGLLRVGTGLSLLEGMEELDKDAEKIDVRKYRNRLPSPDASDVSAALGLQDHLLHSCRSPCGSLWTLVLIGAWRQKGHLSSGLGGARTTVAPLLPLQSG